MVHFLLLGEETSCGSVEGRSQLPKVLAYVDRSAAWDSSFDDLLFLASQCQESPPSGR